MINSDASRHVPDGIVTENFSVPKGLERAVDFWIDVYSRYDVDEIIIHDSVHYIIYEVIDVSAINALPFFTDDIKKEIIESRVESARNRYRDSLLELNSNLNTSKIDHLSMSIYEKFKDIDEQDKFLKASRPGRIRTQRGHRSNFREGLYYSGKYVPTMEKIFQEYNLPLELVRLPYVESYFSPHAISNRNAAGIWQFMRATAKEYMKVEDGYDERRDPILSTHAAAKLLKKSYKFLDNDWPLAVTSYNHGRFGMRRAVRAMGTNNLVDLIRNYNGRNFGYATKNFYAQFLAALYIDKNQAKIFGKTEFAKMGDYKFIEIIAPVSVSEIAKLVGLSPNCIARYNPSVLPSIVRRDGSLPRGARIRVPLDSFESSITMLNDDSYKSRIRFI